MRDKGLISVDAKKIVLGLKREPKATSCHR